MVPAGRKSVLLFICVVLYQVHFVQSDKIRALKYDIKSTLRCRKNPGLAVAVIKDGEVVLAEGFGVVDVNKDIPVTNRTLFGIASLSKAFAATLLLKLISRRQERRDNSKTFIEVEMAGFEPKSPPVFVRLGYSEHPTAGVKSVSGSITLFSLLAAISVCLYY